MSVRELSYPQSIEVHSIRNTHPLEARPRVGGHVYREQDQPEQKASERDDADPTVQPECEPMPIDELRQ